MEESIKKSLMALMDAIKRADAAAIARETRALDGLLAGAGASLDPRLAHFLGNRSYAKALMLLGGDPEVPGGSCGPRGKGA
jgi:hypothetical protein